jgi:hypothetical protein
MILEAILELQKQVGGYISVDSAHKFQWTATLAKDVGKEIRDTKNMTHMKVSENFENIKTRLHGKGRGLNDDTRLVSQQDADTQATYGILAAPYTDSTVQVQSQLDERTANRLEITKVPQKSVTVGAIDLSFANTPLDYSHETIDVGDRVRIINSALGEIIETNIVSLVRSLSFPMAPTIQVADPAAGSTLYPAGGAPDSSVPEALTMDTTVVTTTPPVNMLGFSQDGFVGRLGDALEKLDKLQNKDVGVLDSILIEMGIDPEDPTTTPIVDLDVSPVSDFSPAFDQITTYNPAIAPATDPTGTLPEQITDLLDIDDPDEVVTWDPDTDEP